MNCPKHPNEKMTLLLHSYVCDICDPPKSAKKQEEVKISSTEEHTVINVQVDDIKTFGNIPIFSTNSIDDQDMFDITSWYLPPDYPGAD